MTLPPASAAERRATGASRRRWWVLGAVLGGLVVAVSVIVSRPAIPAQQVEAATAVGRPHRVSPRRWWVLGAVVGVMVVAVTVVAVAPSTTAEHIVPERTAVAAWSSVPEVPEVPEAQPSGGVAPVEIPAAAADVATIGTPRSGTVPVAPAEPRPTDDNAAATPAPTATALPESVPTRVRIPAIDLDSDLIALGLEPDGSMEVPPGAFPAGWYTGAPTPGELGPAVLAGHVDYGGSAGVFSRLGVLTAGDTVEVERLDGSTAVFRVTRVEQHDKDAFPTAAVYDDIDHAGLRLITCGGPFDRRVDSYEDNVVVFAELDNHQT